MGGIGILHALLQHCWHRLFRNPPPLSFGFFLFEFKIKGPLSRSGHVVFEFSPINFNFIFIYLPLFYLHQHHPHPLLSSGREMRENNCKLHDLFFFNFFFQGISAREMKLVTNLGMRIDSGQSEKRLGSDPSIFN